jgi:hypothetical protein
MKRLLSTLGLVAAFAALSGCYYDPGYSYVRSSGYSGDAYYGEQVVQPAYSGGYYDDYYGNDYGNEYDGGYAPGVSIGISSGWYGNSGGGYYRRDHRDRDGDRGDRGDRDHNGHGGRADGDHDGREHHGRGDGDHGGPAYSDVRGQSAPSSPSIDRGQRPPSSSNSGQLRPSSGNHGYHSKTSDRNDNRGRMEH